jgi:hypothetical protein
VESINIEGGSGMNALFKIDFRSVAFCALSCIVVFSVTLPAQATLPAAAEWRTIRQIAQIMEHQNPKQADRESNQCFLEIMDVKEDVVNSPISQSNGTRRLSTPVVSPARYQYK